MVFFLSVFFIYLSIYLLVFILLIAVPSYLNALFFVDYALFTTLATLFIPYFIEEKACGISRGLLKKKWFSKK